MSTFVGVISTPRSGSSMVAGMLHHAGVSMGDMLSGAAVYNEKGIFEHFPFYALNHAIAYKVDHKDLWGFDTIERFPDLCLMDVGALRQKYEAEAKRLESDLWGAKQPLLGVAWPFIHDCIPGRRRLIILRREWSSIVDSGVSVSPWIGQNFDTGQVSKMYSFLRDANEKIAATWPDVLSVKYEDILANPEREAERILSFAEHGTGVKLSRDAAVKFVDPSLNHHGVMA